jgi:hypothetical protein
VVGANNAVWTYDTVQSRMTRITQTLDVEDTIWAHDGLRVTYSTGVDVRSMAIDGSGKEEILISTAEAGGRRMSPVAWSADGKTLALKVNVPGKGGSDIAVYRDGKIQFVADSRFHEEAGDLSPDGRWLAYFSNDTNRRELYVRNLLDSSQKIPVSNGGAVVPLAKWTKGGQELIYLAPQGFVAVPFTPGPPAGFGKPVPILTQLNRADFEPVYADVAADGSRFVFILRKRQAPLTDIRVITNWTQQLAEHWR